MIRQVNMVDFEDIFNFAEVRFDMEWNTCCVIFHNGHILICDEGKDQEFTLKNINEILNNPKKLICNYTKDKEAGYHILKEFMEEHKLEDMYVANDF
jgi:hypothetical protein